MADEKKFINATAFDKTLCDMIRNICSGSGNRQVADGVCLALAQLRAAPPADVTEVVQGRWEHLGGDEWCCTACGNVIHTEGSWEKPKKKYCDECGAKMKGENEYV